MTDEAKINRISHGLSNGDNFSPILSKKSNEILFAFQLFHCTIITGTSFYVKIDDVINKVRHMY